jgi:hypothetical protein
MTDSNNNLLDELRLLKDSVKNFFEPYSYSSNFLTKMETIHNTTINSIK